MMKKEISALRHLFFLSVFMFSGQHMFGQQNYKLFTGPILSVNKDFSKPDHNVVGTPYYNLNFLPAIIGNSKEIAPIRYDAFLDRLEVSVDDKVYEIPKNDEITSFKITSLNATIVYLKEEGGYYFRMVDGKNQLLRKEKINLQVVKPSIEPNSTIREGYSKYEKANPTYYIKTEQSLIKIPKSTKEFLSLFPERKTELERFIKENKINLKQELSLVKLVQYLNS